MVTFTRLAKHFPFPTQERPIGADGQGLIWTIELLHACIADHNRAARSGFTVAFSIPIQAKNT
jgi:hypothetical protein